jgi:hypothetical protein
MAVRGRPWELRACRVQCAAGVCIAAADRGGVAVHESVVEVVSTYTPTNTHTRARARTHTQSIRFDYFVAVTTMQTFNSLYSVFNFY